MRLLGIALAVLAIGACSDSSSTTNTTGGGDTGTTDQDIMNPPDEDVVQTPQDTESPQDTVVTDTAEDAVDTPEDAVDTPDTPPVDFDKDGVPKEDDCDDEDSALGSQELDTDCDGVLNEFDQLEGPDSNLYGIGFQDPVGTNWSTYLGSYTWSKHAQAVADLNVAQYASSRRWLMRNYHSVDTITEHDGVSIDWRDGNDTAWIAMSDEAFQEHVNIFLERLKAHDQAYIDEKKLNPAQWAVFQSGKQYYAIDVEASNWDNRFFYELISTTFIQGYIEVMGEPASYIKKLDDFVLFEKSGDAETISYAPTTKWQILAEAHIAHLEFCKSLLGENARVSYYGGPWDARDVHLARGLTAENLTPEQLKEVTAAAMKRVKNIPLLTGTMQRFIDAVDVNGAQWYPPLYPSWSPSLDMWSQAIFDAKVYGMAQASLDASPNKPKGGMWLAVGGPSPDYTSSGYAPMKVTPKDAKFTGPRWPDADPTVGNFTIKESALYIKNDMGEVEQEGVAAFWPMPAGVLQYIAASLKAHSVYGFGFLTISGLKPNADTAQHRANGYNNVTWDDPEWNYKGTLVAFEQDNDEEAQASHEFMVDLFYDHILSAIRLPAP